MDKYVRVNLLVSGRVQGVGYRYFAYDCAKKIGLNGYVKNLFNGTVELEVEGEQRAIEDFIRDLKTGPSSSCVKNIEVKWSDYKNEYSNFTIKF